MAFAVPAQAAKASRVAAGAAASLHGLSPAAQALAPKKPSGFLQLFRKLAGAGGQTPPGRSRRSGAAAEASRRQEASGGNEFRAQASEARAGAKPRRGEARRAERRARAPGWPEAAALPAASGRPRAAAPQEAASAPAVQARSAPRTAQARLFVVDLRARRAQGEGQPAARGEAAAPEREQSPRSFERAMLAREAGNGASGSAVAPGSATSRPASAPDSSGSVPAQGLRERLLPEIVRQAGIVLRDGGEGEIRLVLKPEHLGSVRIRLQLGESSLEGRIVVDNSNVKELLDAHLEQLKSALRQEGWASANIDVTVSGGGDGRRELPSEPAPPAASGRTAGQFERATPAALDLGFTTVNLLA